MTWRVEKWKAEPPPKRHQGRWAFVRKVASETDAEAVVRDLGRRVTARATRADGLVVIHADPSSYYRLNYA